MLMKRQSCVHAYCAHVYACADFCKTRLDMSKTNNMSSPTRATIISQRAYTWCCLAVLTCMITRPRHGFSSKGLFPASRFQPAACHSGHGHNPRPQPLERSIRGCKARPELVPFPSPPRRASCRHLGTPETCRIEGPPRKPQSFSGKAKTTNVSFLLIGVRGAPLPA